MPKPAIIACFTASLEVSSISFSIAILCFTKYCSIAKRVAEPGSLKMNKDLFKSFKRTFFLEGLKFLLATK